MHTLSMKPDASSAIFSLRLDSGRTRLYTWFDDPEGIPLLEACYVRVTRQ